MTTFPYRLGDVPDGWTGWIRGRITGAPGLVAPVSGRPCVYYQVLVQAELARGSLATESETEPVILEDGTGRALVEPARGFVHVVYDHVLERPTRALLARYRIDRTDVIVREGVLEVGQWVSAHGRCLREPDRDQRRIGGYREGPPTLVRVGGGGPIQLWLSEVDYG